MNSLITIVIPFYNAEKYLTRCITSVLQQTYSTLQIILVNDGSMDQSLKIAERFAEEDNRIVVINKQNGGSSSARKAGIQKATGEYILFIDSDDWIEKDYIESLYKVMKDTKADIVCADIYYDSVDGTSSRVVKNIFPEGLYTANEVLDHMLFAGEFWSFGIQPHMVTKLFRTSKLYEFIYAVDERITFGEDAAVIYPYLMHSKNICIMQICGYHYIQYPNSMARKIVGEDEGRIAILMQHLRSALKVCPEMEIQLGLYEKFLWILRCPEAFDRGKLTKLQMYGGIPTGSKVVIYGAGGAGTALHDYLEKLDRDYQVVSWVDQNALYYRSLGLDVVTLEELSLDFDFVLIANTSNKTEDAIRTSLLHKGVEQEKIRRYVF